MPHIDLLNLPYFHGISLEDVLSLVDLMAPSEHQAGDDIVHEGNPCPPPLYIATAGVMRITKRNGRGMDCHLAQLESPTLFGEIELICQVPAVASVVALSRVCAFSLSREKFDHLFAQRHPAIMQFTLNVAKVACHRLAIADQMLADLLRDEDLVRIRETVYAKMADGKNWTTTTGAFPRPSDE